MSYKIAKIIISMAAGVLLLAAYGVYAFGKVQSGAAGLDDLKFWASTILVFIGIGIVVMIVIEIIFHILLSIAIAVKAQVQTGKCDEQEIEKTLEQEMVEDEMDKLIELKSVRTGFAVVGLGFAAALLSLVLNGSPAVMLNILFASFAVSSLIEGITKLYFYGKGIKNG
jgi:hypothetical protein